MQCPECGKELRSVGQTRTLLGYMSPPGHDHDDNCVKRGYICTEECGYKIIISKRNRCPHPDCDWVGKAECFCHEGPKVDEWPE